MELSHLPLVFLIFNICSVHSAFMKPSESWGYFYSQHGGVSTNFNFYGTTKAPARLDRIPRCPASVNQTPWLLYGNPPRCYLAETKGPCPVGELLLPQPNSQYGICACECILYDYDSYQTVVVQKQDRFVQCIWNSEMEVSGNNGLRYQLFDKKEKKCHAKYEKGPCQKYGTVITGFNATSLECLPLCQVQDKDWMHKHWKKMCRFHPAECPICSHPLVIGRNTCSSPRESFSRTLMKCVRRGSGRNGVVG